MHWPEITRGHSPVARLVPFIIIILGCVLLSCGDDASTDSPVNGGGDPSGSIGPGGGRFVDSESGVTVDVPAGALKTTEQLTCTCYTGSDIPDSLQSSMFGSLGLIDLGPDGLEFDSAVTVTVPVTEPLTPGEQFPLFVWNETNQSWEMTEFMCTASTDGQSFSTEITHFSVLTADNGWGADGVFGDLRPDSWSDVGQAFTRWYTEFKDGLDVGSKTPWRDCCMGITGLRFTIDYGGSVVYVDSHEEGSFDDYDELERFEVSRADSLAGYYLYLTAEVYWTAQQPDEMRIEASRSLIDLSDETALTSEIKAAVLCDNAFMEGLEVSFTVHNDPIGIVDPVRAVVGADGYAHTTFTAIDTGITGLSAHATTCQDWNHPVEYGDGIDLTIDSSKYWSLHIEISFDHETMNLSFHDDISMDIGISASETGEITCPTGQGSHAASLGTSAPDCSVTQSYAPDFVPCAFGQMNGSNMVVTIAPVAGWALNFTLTCIIDEKPEDIPLPPYNYLIPSIMAAQVFNQISIPFENGATVSGSGQDTEWSTEFPITYAYTISVTGEPVGGKR